MLHGNGPIDLPSPLDYADAGKLGPAFAEFLVQPGQVGNPQRLPGLDPAMALFDGLIPADGQAPKAGGLTIREEFPPGHHRYDGRPAGLAGGALSALGHFQITAHTLPKRVGVQSQRRRSGSARQIEHPQAIRPFGRHRQQFGQAVRLLL